MTDNYDITPAGGSSPKVRLYNDSLDAITRSQMSAVQRHGTIEGSRPNSTFDGLQPGDVGFHGFWLGNNASDLADTLRVDFYDNESTTRVDVQAVDGSGTNQNSPYNGTYKLADEGSIDKPVSNEDRIWEYRMLLVED